MPNKVFHNIYRKAASYLNDPTKLNELVTIAMSKVSSFEKPEKEVKNLVSRIRIFLRMVKSYISKEYTQTPWKTMLAIIAGLIYFITPTDLIPDFIPVSGMVDDFAVLLWIFNNFQKDIDEYIAWENEG